MNKRKKACDWMEPSGRTREFPTQSPAHERSGARSVLWRNNSAYATVVPPPAAMAPKGKRPTTTPSPPKKRVTRGAAAAAAAGKKKSPASGKKSPAAAKGGFSDDNKSWLKPKKKREREPEPESEACEPAGTVVTYYLYIGDDFGGLSAIDPVGAAAEEYPNLPHFTLVGVEPLLINDSDEYSDFGFWQAGVPGYDNATTGQWEEAIPVFEAGGSVATRSSSGKVINAIADHLHKSVFKEFNHIGIRQRKCGFIGFA